MSDAIPGRLGLGDLIVLEIITAAGLAAGCFYCIYGADDDLEGIYAESFARFALVGSIGLIPLFLKRPRPPLARVAQQPGFTACVVVVSVVMILLLDEAVIFSRAGWLGLISPGRGFSLNLFLRRISDPDQFGQAVAACWICQYLSGRWRAESSLPDRLGRCWGAYWIIFVPVYRIWAGWPH